MLAYDFNSFLLFGEGRGFGSNVNIRLHIVLLSVKYTVYIGIVCTALKYRTSAEDNWRDDFHAAHQDDKLLRIFHTWHVRVTVWCNVGCKWSRAVVRGKWTLN